MFRRSCLWGWWYQLWYARDRRCDRGMYHRKETMEPTFTVVGDPGQKPIGLCGSGIIDVISELLFSAGIINPKGKMCGKVKELQRQIRNGSYVIAFQKDAGSEKDVEITEVDIDNFIRAKGAIFSAIRTMLNSLVWCIDDRRSVCSRRYRKWYQYEECGQYRNVPGYPAGKFHYTGNSSLSGAYTMLLSKRSRAYDIPGCIQYDLSGTEYRTDLYGWICCGMLYSTYGYQYVPSVSQR